MAYSFSQLQVYRQCPRKYQYQYIDKIEKEFESSPDLLLGQSVHKALENLYKKINIFVIPSEDELIADFRKVWESSLAEATAAKPLQMKGDMTLEEYVHRGIMYLKSYYEKYAPFSGVKVIATEDMIHFALDAAGNQKFRGVIDRIDKEGDTFIINDYKTNKNLPSEQKEDYVEQLTLYGLALQQKYAKYFTHIKARLHYLHFDLTDEREITPERLASVVEKYSALISQVDHEKFAYNMGDKKAFAPQTNDYCKYCEYMSICPLWAHMKYEDEVVGGELGEKTIKGLVDEYVSFSRAESENKAQKENLKSVLVEYLEQKWLLKLFGNSYKISASQLETISIKDKDRVQSILAELGVLDEAMDIDRFKLQKLIKEHKVELDALDGSVEKNVSWVLRGS